MARDRCAVKDAQYTEFFMKNPARPAHRGDHAMKSTVDSVIYGRDMDKSGENPHGIFRQTYSDYAGRQDSGRSPRPFRRGQHAMASTADSVIWGRDIDKSGDGTHAQLRQSYADHAGNTSGDASPRPFRKPDYAAQSEVDSIIWGRDMDKSGENPHDHFRRSYGDHAGSLSGTRSPRPSRKGDYSMRSTMDDVLFGRDLDLSGADPHQQFLTRFEGHAGMRAVSPRDACRMDWLSVPGSDKRPVRRACSTDSARSDEPGSTRTPSPSAASAGSPRRPAGGGARSASAAGAPAATGAGSVEDRGGQAGAGRRTPSRAAVARQPQAVMCERPRWR